MIRPPRFIGALLMLPWLLALAFGARYVFAAPNAHTEPMSAAGPQVWTVLVGGQTEVEQTEMGPAGAWQFMRFYPDKITINEGDTIVWKLNSAEAHDVVFPPPGQSYVPLFTPEVGPPPEIVANPLVAFPAGDANYDGSAAASSGTLQMTPPALLEYRLTFTKAGTFNYVCAIHSAQLPDGRVVGMVASVTVQATGSALPQTPDQVSAGAQAEVAADAQAAEAANAQAKQVPASEPGPNGTMIYHGNIGYDTETMAYMRFSPRDFTIHVGDTIEWKQNAAASPHTITLLSGEKEPDQVLVQPQPWGQPKIVLNPTILTPSGGSSYAGQGFFNSGLLNGTQDPAPGPRTYRLTFTRPGTYEYICILHDTMGMNGHITVLAAGANPGMPATGSAGHFLLEVALAGALMLGAGLCLRIGLRKANRIAAG